MSFVEKVDVCIIHEALSEPKLLIFPFFLYLINKKSVKFVFTIFFNYSIIYAIHKKSLNKCLTQEKNEEEEKRQKYYQSSPIEFLSSLICMSRYRNPDRM